MPYLNDALPQRLHAALLTLICCCLTAAAAQAEPLVPLPVSHIPAQVATAKLLGPKTSAPDMTLDFILPLRDREHLQEQIARVSNPRDPLYGHYLTAQQFTDAYGPTVADVSAVAAFAKSKGLSLASVSGNKTLLQVAGSSATIETAFGVHLDNYRGPDGRVFFAPDSEPVFPASIASRIIGLAGLDNATVRHSNCKIAPSQPTLGSLPDFAQPIRSEQPAAVSGSGTSGYLAPSDIKSIYRFPTTGGAGQTLAVFELDGYTPSDITTYDNYYFPGQATVPIQNILVDGYSGAALPNGAGEVTLDLEMMIALCPSATKILCYEAPNSNPGSVELYARIASDNLASVVSTSWGAAESGTSPSSSAMSENQSFMQMALQGQSMFAASGDSGAYANDSGLSVQNPGSQPFLTSVGGTFLNDTASYAYSSESAWNDPSDTSEGQHGAGSGGGISAWWPIPSYQNGFINAATLGSTTQRDIPDVSLFGDFDESYYSIYFQGGFAGANGTSAAAPLWAAYAALMNQRRASFNPPIGTMGFLNPSLYLLAGNGLAVYVNDFHDINDGSTNLFYPAVTGYDLATGLGSPQGTSLLDDLTDLPIAPAISSFTPTSGPPGTHVTIKGSNFDDPETTQVAFGGTAASFNIVSTTTMTATVPSGASLGAQAISISSSNGSCSSLPLQFTVTPPAPTIASFTPTSGPGGTNVTITGTNFTGATAVAFNGAPAAFFSVTSDSEISAVVPVNATSGPITVTTPSGTAASSANFAVTPPPAPTITSFAPASGPVGTAVTITGTNLTGATVVGFQGEHAASFTVNGAGTQITTTVPTGAATGPIAVLTPAGEAKSSTSFTVTVPTGPTITGFSPASGPVGTSVTITGANLTGATVVGFTNAHATSFTVNSSTQITTTVPSGAATGPIAVLTPAGEAKSPTSFTVTVPTGPTITGFSPASGPVGTSVTITGTDLTGTTVVGFTGAHATSFTVNSNGTQIAATVPTGALTGPITLLTNGVETKSTASFTVTATPTTPTITSFSPASGVLGANVVINGTNLTGTTVVGFTGAHATSFTINSNGTQITTFVPLGAATGPIAVATPAGEAKSAASFTVASGTPIPHITSFTPASGAAGTAVTITGIGLTGASVVGFTGAHAASFTVSSNGTQIMTKVPAGAVTGPIAVAAPGGTAKSTTSFTVP